MKIKQKTVKLKNGKEMVLVCPVLEDAEEIARYLNTIASQTRFISMDEKDKKADKEGEEKWIKEILANKKALCLLAKVDGKIVGVGNIDPKRGNRIRFNHVCLIGVSVLKEYWRLGIASTLMNNLIAFAIKAGYEQIELDAVSSNEVALHIYSKLGFKEVGKLARAMKYPDGSYEDITIMQKFLV